jgi:hypothetical protein
VTWYMLFGGGLDSLTPEGILFIGGAFVLMMLVYVLWETFRKRDDD